MNRRYDEIYQIKINCIFVFRSHTATSISYICGVKKIIQMHNLNSADSVINFIQRNAF